MKPLIGILGNNSLSTSTVGTRELCYANTSYINAVDKAGGIPVIIPITTDYLNIEATIKRMDGIILSGGIDVNPLVFNEEPKVNLGEINDDLDEFNIKVIEISLKYNKPMLGICRGLQVLNVALGGTLHQDIAYSKESYIKHSQSAPYHTPTHTIKVEDDSILSTILPQEAKVNSYHHQCINKLGEGLKITAYSKDNIIEAIEKIDSNFVVGLQWHPELMVNTSNEMLNIFKCFVNKCI